MLFYVHAAKRNAGAALWQLIYEGGLTVEKKTISEESEVIKNDENHNMNNEGTGEPAASKASLLTKMGTTRGRLAMDIFLIVLCLVSFLGLSRWASDQNNFKYCIETINEKEKNVAALTGISAAGSFALSLIPGDAGSALADKLADLSGYLIVISAALYLGKCLLVITGIAAFRFIIPIGCIILLAASFFTIPKISEIVWKAIIFSLILFMLVPISTAVSGAIDKVSDETISERVESMESDTNEIAENTSDADDGTVIDKISDFFKKVSGGVSGILDRFKVLLQNMVTTIATMLITSVVIPVLVLLVLIWLANMLFKTDLSLKRGAGKVTEGLKRGEKAIENNVL